MSLKWSDEKVRPIAHSLPGNSVRQEKDLAGALV